MTAVTKFMFDVQFDPEIEPAAHQPANSLTDDENAADIPEDATGNGESEEEEEELPGYSEAQLEEAKAESFEAGKLEGARDAASTIEKETLLTVQAISLHITDLFGRQEQANSVLLRDGIGIASTITRKLFPAMNEQNALGEIDRMVEHTLLRLIEEPRVVLRVNPDLMETLDKRVGDLKAGAGYEGRIVLKDDPSLPFGDCRMEWGDGSAERNVASLWQSIDQIIEGNLDTESPHGVHQGAVEISALAAPEPESPGPAPLPPGNDEIIGQTTEENHRDSMPSEPEDSENTTPEVGVDSASEGNEIAAVEAPVPETPESESPDNDEIVEEPQTEDEVGEENRKEPAPSRPNDGESMMPGEDNGIVDAISAGDEPADVGGEQADELAGFNAPDNPLDEPNDGSREDE